MTSFCILISGFAISNKPARFGTIHQNLKFKAIKLCDFKMDLLVISNRTRAARSFDSEITRMISDQIHSVQLPLLIARAFRRLLHD